MIDSYPYLDVVWQPYLEEGDEGQPQLVQARPYFGRSVWLYALNLVLPLNLFLCQHSLGLRQSAVEFPTRDPFRRPSRSFRGLHDTTDWRVRAQEQINNWEHRGKAVKSAATMDDAYLGKVYKSARHQVDVAGEIASLRALLRSATQDREVAQKQVEELRRELDRVRSAAAGGASSSRGEESHQRELTDQLAAAVLRAEEAERDLADRVRELRTATDRAFKLQGQMDSVHSERGRLQGEMETVRGERDELCIRAEAAEARAEETTRELEALLLRGPSGGQEEIARLRFELQIQQGIARGFQEALTAIGRSRSRSGASASRHTGASVGQHLTGSSSRRRNEEEERRRRGEASSQSAGGGGGMLLPPDRHEGSGESGGG
ncbi:hypothetical protein Taro_007991 [Colocasia esculenta]|uniref:Uncharacterized protein n=1 Tax=Colocasia esculenta TaxID=4460 RepID=A0A843TVV7_COLES|nr:hypothetical protein [Colocasia esculenta]